MEGQKQLVSQVAEDVKHLWENMRREKGRIKYLKKKARPDMQRVIFEPDEIREMLHMIREDTKLCKKHFFEEKTQMKWMNFQAEKRRKKLDQTLERIIQESDQLDILKKKMDQQRQETEKKWRKILTLLLISEKIKNNLEKSTEEIRSTNEEMLKTQQKIKKSTEIKTYMDKLACIKNQINEWKLTQLPVTSGLLKEKLEGIHREVRSEILTDTAKKSDAEKNPLENIRTSEGYVIEEKTEIHEKFLKHISQRESFPQEIPTLEKQLYKLNEQEEVLKVQIKTNIRKLQDKTQKMKSIVTELDEIQCQKEDAEVIIREMGTGESKLVQEVQQRGYLTERTNVFRKQIMQTDLEDQTKTTNVEQKPDKVEKWKEDPQALDKETQVCSDGKYLRLTDLQRLWAEIYRTQQVIKLIKPEIGCQDGTGNETKDLVDNEIKGLLQDLRQFRKLLEMEVGQKRLNLNVDTCIQKSTMKKKRRELDFKLENILRERDELEMLKTQIQRKSEGTQQQLEKILKCQNDIEKIAGKAKERSKLIMCNMKKSDAKVRMIEDLNKKIEASKQRWNEMYLSTSQHKALTEKLKTELGHEHERESLFERENRKRSEKFARDQSFTSKKATQAEETFEELLVLTPHQERLTEEIKLIINQFNHRKCNREEQNLELSERVIQEILRKVSEMLAQETGTEHNKKALLSETNERQKQQMTEGQHSIKTREIGEMEVLNTELEIKRKENNAILKQMVREGEKNERMMNEIKEAKISFKREVQRRRRELDQTLEKIRKEKDELEMLKLKLRQPKAAMFHDNQNAQEQRTVVYVSSENEPKDLEKNGWKITNTQYETLPISPGLKSTINNIRDLGVKMYGYLETLKSEICQFLKHQNVDLDKKREELTALTAGNNTVKENIIRIKSLIGIYKMTKQATRDVDETWKLRKGTHKQECRIKSLTTTQKAQKRKALMTEMMTDETKQQKQKKRKDAKDPFGEINKKIKTDNLEKHVKTHMETLQVLMKEITVKNRKKGTELHKIQATHKSLSNMCMELEVNSVKLVKLIDIIKNIKERILQHENHVPATRKEKAEIPKTKINKKLEKANSSLAETNKEKIKLDVETERAILQQEKQDIQEERERINITEAELDQKAEEASSCLAEINKEKIKLKHLSVSVQRNHERLQDIMYTIAIKQQGRERKDHLFQTQTQELQSKRHQLQKEREEMQLLMTTVSKMREWTKAAMITTQKEKQQVDYWRMHKPEEEMLSIQNLELERERSGLTPREDSGLDESQITERQQGQIQYIKEKLRENIKVKMVQLQQRIAGVENLSVGLGQKLLCLVEQKENVAGYKEVFEREKRILNSLLCDTLKLREDMENRWKQTMNREKEKVTSLEATLKKEKQDLELEKQKMSKDELVLELIRNGIQKQSEILQQDIQQHEQELESTMVELHKKTEETKNLFDGIKKEKSKLKDLNLCLKTQGDQLKVLMNAISSKPQEQEGKGPGILTQTQNLDLCRKKIQEKRQELEVLMKNANSMKEKVKDSMSSVHKDIEQMISMKKNIGKDREKLSSEKKRLERELSECKMRQEELLDVMKSTANLRLTLQGVKDKVCDLTNVKMRRLHKGHKDAQLLCISLEKNVSTIGDQMKTLTPYKEVVEREKINLTAIMSSMRNQKEAMEHQWKQMVDMDKKDLNKKKEELKRETQNLQRVADKVDKEKEALEVMMSNIQTERAILQQEKQDIQEERERINITEAELDQKAEEASSCLAEINKEKIKLKHLSVSVQRNHERLQDIMYTIAIKQQGRERKDHLFQTQTQELQSKRHQLQKEREEMQLLMTTVSKMREWTKAAMITTQKEKQQVDYWRMHKPEEEMLSIQNLELERERSGLTPREDSGLDESQITERQQGQIQYIKEKLRENIKVKMVQLQQRIAGVENLSVGLGQKLLCLVEQKENVAGYKEVFEREKRILNSLLCDTLKLREDMENRWKQTMNREKEKVTSLEATLKKEKQDLELEKQKMSKDELVLELIRNGIQKQSEILQQDIQQHEQELESTMVELHKKTEETKNLFDGIKKEKSKLKDLNLCLKTQGDQLKVLMNAISSKPQEQEGKGPGILTQTQNLDLCRKKIQEKRQELEVLMKNANSMKEKVKDSMSSVHKDIEQMISMKKNIGKDREKLSSEKKRLERELSECKMRQEELLDVMKSTANLRLTLQGVKDKVCDLTNVKMRRLHKGHKDAQLLCISLEKNVSTIGDQMKTLTPYKEVVEREKINLTAIMSSMRNQKEAMEHQWKQMVDMDKKDLNKKKEELKRETQNLQRVADKVDKEKEALEVMMSNIQTERAILQQEKQDIQEERERINITEAELDQKAEEASSCLAEINKEKIKLKHLSVSVQRNHERLQDIMYTIAIKQQGRERKDHLFQTQTQELQSKRHQLQKEREEMQLLMTTVSKMREWTKAAMITTQKEKQQVDYWRMHKPEEEMLSIQNLELERERSGLTPREDSGLDESQITERQQGQIQYIKEKLRENIKVKMVQLQQRFAGVENLSVGLGQKLLCLVEQKENVAGYKEVFEREKRILNSLLCDTLKLREDMENRWKQTMNREKEKVTSLEATLKKEKQDLELEKQKMSKDELVLELIRNGIQKQSEILQQDIQQHEQELESTMVELHKKTEETKNLFDGIKKEKSKLKDLNLCLKTQGDQLKVLMNAISSKPQEQEGKGPGILTQTQNLDLCRKKIQEKRQELEVLMKNANSMKEKVKDSMSSVHKDIEQMISMKKNIGKDREKLSSEKKRLERELSECKMRQEELLDVMKSTANLRLTLQGVKDKVCDLTNVKMRRLHKGHKDAQLLCISLEKNVSTIGDQMKTLTPYKEVVEREKINLTAIMSSMRNQKEAMEHQWKQMVDMDKKDLNKKKEELKRETQNLQRVADKVDKEKEALEVMMSNIQTERAILQQEKQDIQEERERINITEAELDQKAEEASSCLAEINKEKIKLKHLSVSVQRNHERLQDIMYTIAIKQQGRERKDHLFQTQTQELQSKRHQLQKEREEMQLLMTTVSKMREWTKAAMITTQKEKQQVDYWRMHKPEEEMLSIQNLELERERSGLTPREDSGLDESQITERQQGQIQYIKEKLRENIKVKMVQLQQRIAGVENLSVGLGQKLLCLVEQKENVAGYKEVFEREKRILNSLLCDTLKLREDMENRWKQTMNREKEKVTSLEATLKKEKQDLELEKQKMSKDELVLELIRNGIQKQSEILQQDIQQHEQELESTMVELHKKTEETKNLFDGIKKEKSKLKDLNLCLKTQGDQLKVLMNAISSKPQEQEGKGPGILTQTQNLDLCRKKIQEKRQELEVLMKNANSMKEKVKDSMSSVHKDIEQMISMKKNIGKDREKLSSEKKRLERELSECKMRQEELLDVMKSTANLRLTLQGVKDKVCDLTNVKMRRLHKGHKDAQLLCISLEKNVSTIGDQMKTLTPYKEVVEREKINLTAIMSSMRNQKEAMEHQWKQMVDMDKKDLNKKKEELKRETQNLQRVADKVDKEKEALEVMMSNIQTERAILQQEKQDIQEERERINITEAELDQKAEEASSCLAEINKEKIKLKHLSVSVQRNHERLQDIMYTIAIKQQGRERKDHLFQTQTQELQSKRHQLQKEREEMQLLMTTVSKMREWTKAAMITTQKEKQQVDYWRMHKPEEEMLSIQNLELERERSGLTPREDSGLDESQITERQQGQIQYIKEKLRENIKVKMVQLQQRIAGVENLSVGLGQKLLCLVEQKENVAGYKEVFEREKRILNSLLCDTLKLREDMENRWKQTMNREKEKVTSLEATLKKEKQDLELEKQKMSKDELVLELIRNGIQKQSEILQQDIQQHEQELESTMVELHKKTEETKNLFDGIKKEKSKLKDLNLCLKTQGDQLKVLMNAISSKPQEQEGKGPGILTQTQNLDLCRKKIQEKRQELEVLMKNANSMKEKVKDSMSSVHKDIEQMISMKKNIGKDREKLSSEKKRLERELSECKMRQEELLDVMKSTANLRLTLQGVKDKVCDLTNVKMRRLHKGHKDAQLLCISLEKNVSTIGDQMKTLTPYKEVVEREKINLTAIMSSMRNQKEAMEHQWKQMVDMDKKDLNKKKEELKRETQNLQRVADKVDKEKEALEVMMSNIQTERAILQQEKQDIQEERERINITEAELDQKAEEASSCLAEINKEKIKLKHLSVSVQRNHERLQDIMYTIAIKQQGRERKDHLFQTQTQELQSKRHQLQKEREEMQLLMTTVSKMREWTKAAMITTQKEKQQVDYWRMHKPEEEMLSIQNLELERERSGLTPREDSGLDESQITERQQGQIQYIKEKLRENIKVKMVQLQQRIAGVENLSVGLGQKLLCLVEQKENVAGYKEVFEREKRILNSLLCDTLKLREDMENRWKQTMNREKEKVTSLEATLKKEKQDLELEKQKMSKDELVLELIRNGIQKQSEILQQDIQQHEQELESTMVELHKKTEETKNLFDGIKKEKSKLKDLNLCLKTQGDQLKVLMNAISSKPQEQEGKGPGILTQTQNLDLCRKKIQEKRQELEVLMKNANSMKEKVKDSMSSVHKDIEQMISMKKNIGKDREKLSSEKKRLERELSECKMRQEELLDVMKSTANLRLTLQGVKDKVCDLTNVKMRRLHKGHKDAQLLCISLEKNVSTIGDQMKTLTPYKEVVEREKINLTAIMSSMRNQKEAMEHQWKQMVDMDKKDLNKKKEELKRETQNLQRVADKVDKEKEALEVMMSNIQTERAILQQEKQDIQEERERINITEAELDQKAEEASSCLAEINKEKIKLKHLSVSVQRNHERLQDIMYTIAIKQQGRERKDHLFQTQTQELQSKRHQLQKEREEMQLLMTTVSKMREWTKAAMITTQKEKQQVDYWRMHKPEEEMLSIQNLELERERSGLTPREDSGLDESQITERQQGQIQYIKEKLRENIKVKMVQLQQRIAGVENLSVGLGQKLLCLVEQKENVAGYKEVFEREKRILNSLLCDTLKLREDMENRWKQTMNREKEKVTSLEATLKKEKQDLELEKQKMSKDELVLELIRNGIQKQSEILQQDIQQHEQELESTMVELHKKTEETKNLFDGIKKEKSKLKDLNLCLKTQGDQLKVLMNAISSKPQEQEGKGPGILTQTQNLDLCRKKIQEKRQELEVLMKNANSMKEKVKDSMSSVHKDIEQMISMKKNIGKDREKLSSEKKRLERELSECKMRQEELLDVMKSTANLRLTLQGVKDKVCDLTNVKMRRLHKGHKDAQLLCISLEKNVSTIGDQMKTLTPYKEVVEREKINLTAIMSSMRNQKEAMEHQWKQMVDMDKKDLNKKKEELKRETQNLQRVADKVDKEKEALEVMMSNIQTERAILQQEKQDIQEERERINITEAELDQKAEEASSCLAEINKEKIKLKHLSVSVQRNHERLQDIMYTIAIKQQGRERKDHLFQTQTQELQSKRHQLQKEREEMQLLMTTVSKMREWTKAAMITTQKEKQQVDYWRMHKPEEEMLSIQNLELERERSGLTPREDSGLDESQITERQQGQIQYIKEKLRENIKVKMVQLQQRIAGVENLSVGLGQKLLCLVEQKENVAGYKEVFEREKRILNSLLCDTLKLREDMENRWKQTMNREKEKVTSLEATLKKEKQDLELEKQKMSKDELVLELIRNGIQKQSEILQQDSQQHEQELESTMVELHKKTEETKNLFDGIKKEKSKLKDLNLCLKTQGDQLKVLMNAISSKPQEQEGKGPGILTQTQNLDLCRKKIQEKRQELEVLMKNANSMKEKVKDSMSSVHKDIEQMISMKKNIGKDREKLSSEKKRLERELSECKMRQEELLDVMKSTANLRLTLQGVKDKVCDLTNVKMRRLHKGHKDAQLLCISLEKNVSTIGDQMKTLTPYKEVVEREKINLTAIMSSMRNQKEAMEHQWKQMVDMDKKDLNKKKEELKRETQNLQRVADKVDKEKEALEVMMSNIQTERAILQQEKQDIQEERERINITEAELDQKAEEAPMKIQIFSAFLERLGHLNLMTVELFQNSIDCLEGKCQDLTHFFSSLKTIRDVHLIRDRIRRHLNWIKLQRQHLNQTVCDKSTQTVSLSHQRLKTYKQNVSPFKIGTPEMKFQNLKPVGTEYYLISKEDDDLKSLSKYITFDREWPEPALKDNSDVENRKEIRTSPRVSTRTEDYTKHRISNSLQRSWKDTRMEFKEINLMKHRDQEIRNNLDKRLKEIIHFGKITLKETLMDNSLPGNGTHTSTQGNFDSSTKSANIKYVELQQLKFHMLSQIEKLQLKENTSESLVSYEKDNQTFQKEIIPAKVQEMQEQDEARGRENEAVTSSRLFCLLQHYCCRCCCHCCTCRKHVCPKKNGIMNA
ncbi:uncharacterized protein LOC102219462 isoform X2 [Xiphophorus maculatus]|uniref:uncharacterized protein LOC102219462 isoform X2 n=1 Tax=Xiphophorus maculatus TaxID=8083 RepID=UPI000C6E4D2C|nr:uncharacterized protein LOC102219462 isoform X2 [Xiphophorus maculatus]